MTARRLGAMAVLAGAAIAAIVLLRDAEEQEGARRGDFFGVNAPTLRDYVGTGKNDALDALAESIADQGLGWARVAFDQSVEEKYPGEFNWSVPDGVVGALARHGVATQALFTETAYWAADPAVVTECGVRSYPSDVAAWSRFVGEAVARYGRTGSFWEENPDIAKVPIETWEIGNEPNLRIFWCPAGNPRQYAAVYRAARDEALAADPDARVIVGGLSPVFSENAPAGDVTVPEFLEQMVAADPSLVQDIPAVAIHPYGPTPAIVLEAILLIRKTMNRVGLGETPMIVNEVGWHTSGPGPLRASESERAGRTRAITTAAWRDCDLIGFGLHGWVTPEINPDELEHWYGLVDPKTGVPNESGRAYGDAIAALGAAGGDSGSGARSCD